jgi:glycosyl hydrolase family 71
MIRFRGIALGLCLSLCAFSAGAHSASAAPARPVLSHPPVLAYYYIWFDESSWARAKVDHPLLGDYSSDDTDVMRQHIAWAKEAGIDGFIVSWKSTDRLNARLEQLIQVADTQNFKLAIIYQGLDFARNPQPSETVARDLDVFLEKYASDEAFNMFRKPLVIWSGTWEFSTNDIARVAEPRRDRLMILASEKNVAGYERIGENVDGNAYYWSSVNPETFPDYSGKLQALAASVHNTGGTWIAPAAPGFDARMIGGTTVVSRDAGQTLRREMAAASEASPDAIGLISWNEFSENSHIEPSKQFGRQYLDIVASTTRAERAQPDSAADTGVDSSGPGGRSVLDRMPLFVVLSLAVLASAALAGRRVISGGWRS